VQQLSGGYAAAAAAKSGRVPPQATVLYNSEWIALSKFGI